MPAACATTATQRWSASCTMRAWWKRWRSPAGDFEAGVLFARSEGIVPAPESTHAIAAAIREAKQCAKTGGAQDAAVQSVRSRPFRYVLLRPLFRGELQDYAYPEEAIQESLKHLPRSSSTRADEKYPVSDKEAWEVTRTA